MQVGLCLLTAFCCLQGMRWRDSDLLFILIQIFINFMGIPFLRLISSHRQYTIKEHLSVSKFYLVWHFEIKSNVLIQQYINSGVETPYKEAIMLNPIEKFKRSILHLNRSLHHCTWFVKSLIWLSGCYLFWEICA